MSKKVFCTWKHLVFASLLASFPLLGWTAEQSTLTNISANNIDKQIILQLDQPNHATLLSPLDKGQRKLIVDLQGANLSGLPNKSDYLKQVLAELSDIADVSLDEFRGPNPIVRMVIKPKNPSTSAALITNDSNTLVLQLLYPLEPQPLDTRTSSTADKNSNTKPAPSKNTARQPAPSTPDKMTSGTASKKPSETNTLTLSKPADTSPVATKSMQQPASAQTNETLSTGAQAYSRSADMERKIFEAESLRRQRNQLMDQNENLNRLVAQQQAMITQLKHTQQKLAQTPSNRHEKEQIMQLQMQLTDLQKSYDELRQLLDSTQQESTALQTKLQLSQDQATALDEKHSQASTLFKPVPDASSRGGLLNSLAELNQSEIKKLTDAEAAFREGKQAELGGDPKSAMMKYQKALMQAPQVGEYALALGALYARQGNYEQARAVLESALAYHPEDPQLLNELGKTHLFLKDELTALKHFKKALPVAALSNYASTLRRANRLKEAEAVYTIALSVDGSDSDLQFNLGNLYLSQRRFPEAQERFQEAIKLNPRFGEAHYHLGLVYASEGKSAEAVDALNKYLQLIPNASNKDAVKEYIQDLKKAVKKS